MMSTSIARIQAIFMKDYREFSRNYAVSVMMIMPIVMAFIYKDMTIDVIEKMFFPTSIGLGMVTAFVQACLIAEEKERNTLRSLLLSPASLLDILTGKSLLVAVVSTFTLGLSYFIIDFMPSIYFILALLLSIFFYAALGTICGLFAKSTMEATFTVLPAAIIFPFGPFVMSFAESFPIFELAKWLPSSQLFEIANGENLVSAFFIIIAWTVVAWMVAVILCKKRMVD